MAALEIHTIDARDNVMLEVARDYFALTPAQLRRELAGIHQETCELLTSKGLNYRDLKNALIPRADRTEIVLLFDTTKIEAAFYGAAVCSVPHFVRQFGLACETYTGPTAAILLG